MATRKYVSIQKLGLYDDKIKNYTDTAVNSLSTQVAYIDTEDNENIEDVGVDSALSTTVKTGWLKDNNGEKFAPKTLISQVQTNDGILLENKIAEGLDTKADKNHNHDDKYDTKGSANTALSSAKAYTDEKTAKLDEHTHTIANVTGLQSALDGKADSSHGTHVTFDSTNKPKMDGTVAFGTSTNVARADHVHPTDTSRAAKTDFDSHTSNTTVHITSTERTNWGTAYTHSQAAHAPIDAEPNQNAFGNIAVSGQSTVTADSITDTVTFVGSNVSITTDATNDKVTFSVADGTTSAKGLVQLTNSTSSTSTTTAATPNSVKSAYDLANTAKTNAATAQATADEKCIVQMITWEADD